MLAQTKTGISCTSTLFCNSIFNSTSSIIFQKYTHLTVYLRFYTSYEFHRHKLIFAFEMKLNQYWCSCFGDLSETTRLSTIRFVSQKFPIVRFIVLFNFQLLWQICLVSYFFGIWHKWIEISIICAQAARIESWYCSFGPLVQNRDSLT